MLKNSSRRPCGNVGNRVAVIQGLVGNPKDFPSDCGKPVGSCCPPVFHMSGKHGISTWRVTFLDGRWLMNYLRDAMIPSSATLLCSGVRTSSKEMRIPIKVAAFSPILIPH